MSARRVYASAIDSVVAVDLEADGHLTVTPVPTEGAEDRPAAATPRESLELQARHVGPGCVQLLLNGRQVPAWVAEVGEEPKMWWVFVEGELVVLEILQGRPRSPRRPPHAESESLSAPMPATVISILVRPGSAVHRGDPLLLLSAMKMELPLRAPHEARVTAVRCAVGDLVQPGVALVDLEGG